ncbi:MAG: hypothetical protein IT175_13930 [Acidobacteria bacterium]|nr:hypothetical protein [Acidobacteriota bacterium]
MRSRLTVIPALVLSMAFFGLFPAAVSGGVPFEGEQFPTPALKAFHDAMQPLVHEAAPAKDVARIRAAVPDLDAKRSAILRGGTGSAAGKAKLDVVKLLEAFNSSVTKLVQASKGSGNDDAVLAALDSVHTAFEALVAGYPAKG